MGMMEAMMQHRLKERRRPPVDKAYKMSMGMLLTIASALSSMYANGDNMRAIVDSESTFEANKCPCGNPVHDEPERVLIELFATLQKPEVKAAVEPLVVKFLHAQMASLQSRDPDERTEEDIAEITDVDLALRALDGDGSTPPEFEEKRQKMHADLAKRDADYAEWRQTAGAGDQSTNPEWQPFGAWLEERWNVPSPDEESELAIGGIGGLRN